MGRAWTNNNFIAYKNSYIVDLAGIFISQDWLDNREQGQI